MNKLNEAKAFEEVLLNIAQIESIRHELIKNPRIKDGASLFAEAELLKSKVQKYFHAMTQKLVDNRDDQNRIKNIKKKFNCLLLWFNSNTNKKYVVSQFADYPTQIEKSFNYDDQASISESFLKDDNADSDLEILEQNVKEISNGFKQLSVDKDKESETNNNELVSSRKTRSSARGGSLNRLPKITPKRQNRRNKSLGKGLKEPVVFVKNDKSKLMQRVELNHKLLQTQTGNDEAPKAVCSKNQNNAKFSIVHLDTEVVISEIEKPALKLHLVKDNELISLSKYPRDFWDDFSSETSKRMLLKDFF